MTTTLAYNISRDLCNLHCELHHMSLSTRNAKEVAVVKVCCGYFKDEVEAELQKRYGEEFVKGHIRFQLPAIEQSNVSVANFPEE